MLEAHVRRNLVGVEPIEAPAFRENAKPVVLELILAIFYSTQVDEVTLDVPGPVEGKPFLVGLEQGRPAPLSVVLHRAVCGVGGKPCRDLYRARLIGKTSIFRHREVIRQGGERSLWS